MIMKKIEYYNLSDAYSYIPDKKIKTGLIQIGNYRGDFLKKRGYKKIKQYFFDDVQFSEIHGHISTGLQLNQAKKMVADIKKIVRKCDTIIVHCINGESRSPAVVLYIMHTHKEFYDKNLEDKIINNGYNEYVYKTLKVAHEIS